MTQVKTTPMPGPEVGFTVATGPMPDGLRVMKMPDGIAIEVDGHSRVIPSTMAIRLAKQLLDAALGDLHA